MSDVVYCNRCGAQNSALAKFCANCGSPFGGEAAVPATNPAEVTPRPQGPAAPPLASPNLTTATPAYAAPAFPPPAYGAPNAAAPTSVRYAGFWIRFVAFIIDSLVIGVVVLPVGLMISLVIGLAGSAVSMPGTGVKLVGFLVRGAFSVLVKWIYEASMESSSKQATVGKMALGLKVTDEAGLRISFERASARYFAKFLSAMIVFIGYAMAGFTARKQALHDMIAGTLVARTQ